MSLKKQYLKTKPICKVTFRIEAEQVPDADKVFLLGDFNKWDPQKNPMTRLKNGAFKTILDLEPGHHYQFRYLIDENKWENDDSADKYVLNAFGTDENSVLIV